MVFTNGLCIWNDWAPADPWWQWIQTPKLTTSGYIGTCLKHSSPKDLCVFKGNDWK